VAVSNRSSESSERFCANQEARRICTVLVSASGEPRGGLKGQGAAPPPQTCDTKLLAGITELKLVSDCI